MTYVVIRNGVVERAFSTPPYGPTDDLQVRDYDVEYIDEDILEKDEEGNFFYPYSVGVEIQSPIEDLYLEEDDI